MTPLSAVRVLVGDLAGDVGRVLEIVEGMARVRLVCAGIGWLPLSALEPVDESAIYQQLGVEQRRHTASLPVEFRHGMTADAGICMWRDCPCDLPGKSRDGAPAHR